MSDVRDPRQSAFDPFGEPMASACPSGDAEAARRGYGETRRAAILFWALALLFVVGRIYFTEGPSAGTFAIGGSPVTGTEVAVLR